MSNDHLTPSNLQALHTPTDALLPSAPCAVQPAGFLVLGFNSDPAEMHQPEPSETVDRQTRTGARRLALELLKRGHWVEILDGESRELLYGTFSPNAPAPAILTM